MSTTIDKLDFAESASQPQPSIADYARKGLKALASLQLTVVLFAFSILLVFFGTLAQRDAGIWTVVDKYFWSWFVWVPTDLVNQFGQVFFGFPPGSQWSGSLPLPGGKLLGGAMLINLLAAHALRFKLTWKRSGIFLIHSGMILLFVGEFITREFAVEQRMTIDEGASANYTENTRQNELAFVDRSDPKEDAVTVVPSAALRHAKSRISNPDLPVDLEVIQYMVNSKFDFDPNKKNPATAGRAVQKGTAAIAVEQAEVSGVDVNQTIDVPSAYIKLYKKGTDETIGTYMVSLLYSMQGIHNEFEVDGKKYQLSLRMKRSYKPFRVELVKFRFDRYPGTQKAKNYSSDVIVFDANGSEVRRQTIRMNEPMRYEGETFYQQSFEKSETTTILQVVRNPGWLIPYASCAMVGFGLIAHFLIGLINFLTKSGRLILPQVVDRAVSAPPSEGNASAGWLARNFEWLIPAVLVAIAVLYLGSVYARMKPKDPFNLDMLARLPVLEGGRVKPLDSVARVYLRKISHQSDYKDEAGNEQPAIRWYIETLGAKLPDESEPAWSLKVVRIESDQVLAELKLPMREGLRYSVNELRPHFGLIQSKSEAARMKRAAKKTLDPFEIKMIDLNEKLALLLHVAHGKGHDTDDNRFHLLPPQSDGEAWGSLGDYFDGVNDTAFTKAIIIAREKVLAQPGGFDNIAEDHLVAQITKDPTRVPPERRALLVDMVMKADPARIPSDGRGEILSMVMSLLPQAEQDDVRKQLEAGIQTQKATNPAAAQWDRMIEARHAKKYDEFNSLLDEYRKTYASKVPADEISRMGLELNYNRFSPFYRCIGLYVFAFLIGVFGFVFKAAEMPRLGESLRRSAMLVLLLTLLLHTTGLVVRMDLMNRWTVFVTNLYSSAIFIGAGCVALGLILELVFPIGVANIVGAVLGAATTIIAHNIATEDTLQMMEAVLDTNFWLATHVTTVTFGYTATFVAGFLGAAYLFLMFCAVIRESFQTPGQPAADRLFAYGAAAAGVVLIPLSVGWGLFDALAKFEVIHSGIAELLRYGMVAAGGMYFVMLLMTRASTEGVDAHGKPIATPIPRFAKPVAAMGITPPTSKILGQMIYGVLCFATMLSFIGTVLGGIWADQSWGRFWGWDPKENGAVLIVLMNALILHARWCGLVKVRGMAVLTVVGNMVTAWSWFGTNQLDYGLHAYGRNDQLAVGCRMFWISQLAVIALGLIPERFWTTVTAPRSTTTPAPSEPSANGHAPPSSGKTKKRRR